MGNRRKEKMAAKGASSHEILKEKANGPVASQNAAHLTDERVADGRATGQNDKNGGASNESYDRPSSRRDREQRPRKKNDRSTTEHHGKGRRRDGQDLARQEAESNVSHRQA